jgi:hypothetical protein
MPDCPRECTVIVEQFLEHQIRTGIPWRQNNAITWRDATWRHKNDIKGKHGATSRHRSCVIHCFVTSRNSGLNSGGLHTVHTMQIASDSDGPDKYIIRPEKINSCNPCDSDQPLRQFSYWVPLMTDSLFRDEIREPQNHWKVSFTHLDTLMHKFRQHLWNNTDFRWIFKALGDILWPYKEGQFT